MYVPSSIRRGPLLSGTLKAHREIKVSNVRRKKELIYIRPHRLLAVRHRRSFIRMKLLAGNYCSKDLKNTTRACYVLNVSEGSTTFQKMSRNTNNAKKKRMLPTLPTKLPSYSKEDSRCHTSIVNISWKSIENIMECHEAHAMPRFPRGFMGYVMEISTEEASCVSLDVYHVEQVLRRPTTKQQL